MTFYEQWGEPAAGLALAREGLEIGRRRGSRALRVPDGRATAHLRTADRRLGLGRRAPGRVAGHRVHEQPAGRVLRGPRDPPLAPGRGRDGGHRGGEPGSGSRSGSPTRSSSPTSSGPGHGPRSRPAVTTRSAGSGSRGRADELLRPARLPARRPQRAVGRRRRGSRLGPGLARRLRVPRPGPRRPIASSPGPGSTRWRGAARRPSPGTARRCVRTASSGSPSTRRRRPWTWPCSCPPRNGTPPTSATAIGAAETTLERLGARPFLARLDASGRRSYDSAGRVDDTLPARG